MKLHPDRIEARRLAKEIGATISWERRGYSFQVDVVLPEGWVFDCNEDLDAVHHEIDLAECEADAIWDDVVRDLQSAAPRE